MWEVRVAFIHSILDFSGSHSADTHTLLRPIIIDISTEDDHARLQTVTKVQGALT